MFKCSLTIWDSNKLLALKHFDVLFCDNVDHHSVHSVPNRCLIAFDSLQCLFVRPLRPEWPFLRTTHTVRQRWNSWPKYGTRMYMKWVPKVGPLSLPDQCAERRPMHFNTAPAYRRSAEWRTSVRALEPDSEREVSFELRLGQLLTERVSPIRGRYCWVWSHCSMSPIPFHRPMWTLRWCTVAGKSPKERTKNTKT